jgi:4-methyl-5(b-hydroxyethyl)-thiazole monophosphate biosynthesis
MGKMSKVLLFLAEGFEEIEALTVVDVLRRADIKCDMCSITGISVKGSHGIEVKCDKVMKDINEEDYNGVVLPGGMPGSKNLKENEGVLSIVRKFHEEGRIVAAICAAPMVLSAAGIIKGKEITSYPDTELSDCNYVEKIVAEDNNIITSRGPATSIYFALKLVEKLSDVKKANELKSGMMLEFLEDNVK